MIPQTPKVALFGSADELIEAKKQASELGLRVQLRDASAFNPEYGLDSQFKTIVLLGKGPKIERVRAAYDGHVKIVNSLDELFAKPKEPAKPKSIKQSEHTVDKLP
jgi:hypothetical protein